MACPAELGDAFGRFWQDGQLAAALSRHEINVADAQSTGDAGQHEWSTLPSSAVLALLAGRFDQAVAVAREAQRQMGAGNVEGLGPPAPTLQAQQGGSIGPTRPNPASPSGWVPSAVALCEWVVCAVDGWHGERSAVPEPLAGDRWSSGLGLVLASEASANFDTELAALLAADAVGQAERAGDAALLRWADRARAGALVALGEPDAGLALASRLSDAPGQAPAAEAARTDRVVGAAALRAGDDELARARLTPSAEVLATAGYIPEAVLALLALSEADPDGARSHLRRAHELAGEPGADSAFDRMFAMRPTLQVTMLGEQTLSVGGERCRAKTSHAEQLVFSLVLAGRDGLDARDLCERLWPGKDISKAMGSLTTATWDARAALGREAWRLDRKGDRLTLDTEDASVDLDDIMAALSAGSPDRELVQRLHLPLLPAWRHEDWVIDADERRAAVASRLAR